jgi:hypothetical protein
MAGLLGTWQTLTIFCFGGGLTLSARKVDCNLEYPTPGPGQKMLQQISALPAIDAGASRTLAKCPTTQLSEARTFLFIFSKT